MKPYVLIILSFLLFHFSTIAQDILVNKINDTINCKIITISDSIIFYKYWENSKFIKEYANKQKLSSYQKDYYVQNLKNKELLDLETSHYFVNHKDDTIYCNILKREGEFLVYSEKINHKDIVKDIRWSKVKKTKRLHRNIEPGRFEINMRSGYMQRKLNQSTDIPPAQQQLIKEVKNGFFIATSAHYCTESNFSIGVLYNYSRSKGSGNIYFNHNIESIPGMIGLRSHVDIAINYFAIEGLLFLRTRNKKTKLNISANLGPMIYKEKITIINYEVLTKGNTFGYGFGTSLTRIISKGFGLMIHANYSIGEIEKITWTNKNKTETTVLKDERVININQLNIGAGIVIQL
ncbi:MULTISPECIES: hypothetical protein [unclassified Lentimicrobium]|uniref:hypothetical protein n=1 Tax=unclassified Lentimicrobium TaxID=2677434 RepID=UPI001556E8FB|nr:MULTISPECIES: hypothetical protein [unclassified Lentimicrobium]NPD47592.1 hypothetical protein [Lentimicrobium sp. S6]NPD85135.1 hypothetical protein [Lentimicrobium sp. L6]